MNSSKFYELPMEMSVSADWNGNAALNWLLWHDNDSRFGGFRRRYNLLFFTLLASIRRLRGSRNLFRLELSPELIGNL